MIGRPGAREDPLRSFLEILTNHTRNPDRSDMENVEVGRPGE
jgi:hypothetical protein